MSLDSLESIISAIEEEFRQPGPSHSNLARLLILALKTILAHEREAGKETIRYQEGAGPSECKAQKKRLKKQKASNAVR